MTDILVIPCREDNYGYILVNGKSAILVDVPEVAALDDALQARGLDVSSILLTHHHYDHIEGVDEMRAKYGAKVYGAGADRARLPALDRTVKSGDRLDIDGIEVDVLAADGHTKGHIAYFVLSYNALFSGDSLMVWGCGRLFEGSAADMWQTIRTMKSLPPEIKLYSGHNYAASNGRFALSLEPDNPALLTRMAKVTSQDRDAIPTCPSTLAEEFATNPFCRADDEDFMRKICGKTMQPEEFLAIIREKKDRF